MILSPTALNFLSALVDLLDIKKWVKKMSDKICYKILKITIVLIKFDFIFQNNNGNFSSQNKNYQSGTFPKHWQ